MARKLNSQEAQEFAVTIQRERTGVGSDAGLFTRFLAEWPESDRPAPKGFEWPDDLSFNLPDS